MTRREPKRRAGEHRQRALQSENHAAGIRNAADRRHVLDLTATFRRTADTLAAGSDRRGISFQLETALQLTKMIPRIHLL
jgi:hypothetical protein